MELTLFIIIGAVAVVAAAMMLISENAVYSALFLILNFACIAFFFLMLNAAFLAMVQIAVYAGAIMVLFLFVIMLLGAERLQPDTQPRFRWLTPVAILLALIFLITTSAAVIDGKIDLTKPRTNAPQVRVVNGMGSVPTIDVYLDGQVVAADVAFRQASDFEAWQPGHYTAVLFAAGADPNSDSPLAEQEIELQADDVLSLTAIGALTDEAHLVPAREDVSQIDEKGMLRVVAVNGLHARDTIDVVTDADNKDPLIQSVPYGSASSSVLVDQGTYDIGVYPEGNRRTRLSEINDQELDSDTSVLWVFTEEQHEDNSWTNVVISKGVDVRAAFGSPAHVGQLLFSKYVLPFELVALLLLVAMIGAIVLTHETVTSRRQVVRRLANPPAGLDKPITAKSGE